MTSIFTALCLPAPDVEALCLGRTIVAMTLSFINPPGRKFALYPGDITFNALPPEQYYQPSFLPTVNSVLNSQKSEKALIKAWAKCELCQELVEAKSFQELSKLTVWTEEALHQTLAQRGKIFLAYLRVYYLPEPLEISVNNSSRFVSLPNNVAIANSTPVLNDTAYEQRYRLTVNRQIPPHLEFIELENAIAQFLTQPLTPQEKIAALSFKQEINQFIGLTVESNNLLDPDLNWINTIAEVGNSSDGYTFEKLIRKSLIKLGFENTKNERALKDSLDPEATGGAGGLDFYADLPYAIVGECKASKTEKVPDGTPAQLVKLGQKFLKKEKYEASIKIIMAAGRLTSDANLTAIGNEMNVIRPETLQRLMKLKAYYPGAINLIELKPCLQNAPFGEEADQKVNVYIEEVLKKLNLRSHLIQVVKEHLEKDNVQNANVEQLRTAYLYSGNLPQPLTQKQFHEILIELSSPLAGYLGRIENPDGSDRFYFIRSLTVVEL